MKLLLLLMMMIMMMMMMNHSLFAAGSIRSLKFQLDPGQFASWNFLSMELLFQGTSVPGNFRTRELLFHRTWNFCSQNFRSQGSNVFRNFRCLELPLPYYKSYCFLKSFATKNLHRPYHRPIMHNLTSYCELPRYFLHL